VEQVRRGEDLQPGEAPELVFSWTPAAAASAFIGPVGS
jgi:hypothetical protein